MKFKSKDALGTFFDGLSKYVLYNKLEVWDYDRRKLRDASTGQEFFLFTKNMKRGLSLFIPLQHTLHNFLMEMMHARQAENRISNKNSQLKYKFVKKLTSSSTNNRTKSVRKLQNRILENN
ncbi:hypothetical protein RYX36_025740 [Vicia faba]